MYIYIYILYIYICICICMYIQSYMITKSARYNRKPLVYPTGTHTYKHTYAYLYDLNIMYDIHESFK